MGFDENNETQIKMVYRCFYGTPKTMKEVFVLTGVIRESICRYCATLEKEGKLFRIRQRQCSITKENNVWEFTSNPDLIPIDRQQKLF